MAYFKKVNQFKNIIWVAELEQCTDVDAVEISEEEYNFLVNADTFD